jgi:hypothetical protein
VHLLRSLLTSHPAIIPRTRGDRPHGFEWQRWSAANVWHR